VKDALKATGLPRYKLVVHATIGQRAGQAIRLASRGLWDASTDRRVVPRRAEPTSAHSLLLHSFVSETFENDSLFASVQVFAVYFE